VDPPMPPVADHAQSVPIEGLLTGGERYFGEQSHRPTCYHLEEGSNEIVYGLLRERTSHGKDKQTTMPSARRRVREKPGDSLSKVWVAREDTELAVSQSCLDILPSKRISSLLALIIVSDVAGRGDVHRPGFKLDLVCLELTHRRDYQSPTSIQLPGFFWNPRILPFHGGELPNHIEDRGIIATLY